MISEGSVRNVRQMIIVAPVVLMAGCCATPGQDPPGAAAMRLDTELGTIHCELFRDRAPRAVALVVGIAQGQTPYRDPESNRISTGRYYDGLTFFRRIPGVMVQTGCPIGNGTGHPGFRIEAELHEDDERLLQTPGAIVMARYRKPPNRKDPSPPPPGMVIGSQFSITLRPMPHLAGELPVFGRCRNLDVVRALSLTKHAPVLEHLRVPGAKPDTISRP